MFESIKGRKKEILNNAKEMLDVLDSYLDNYDLMSIFSVQFNKLFDEKKYYVSFSTDNEICIRTKKSEDMFHLLITPSLKKFNSLAFHIVSDNGIHEEEVTIQFKDNTKQVIVTEHIIDKSTQGKKREVLAISNKTNIRNYIKNELRYEYNYETETCFRIDQNYSCATLSETFVDLDHNAVRRVGHISEDGYYDNPADIVYYESNAYSVKPFDTRHHSIVENKNMGLSTEEKFYEFVNNANNATINLRKQK